MKIVKFIFLSAIFHLGIFSFLEFKFLSLPSIQNAIEVSFSNSKSGPLEIVSLKNTKVGNSLTQDSEGGTTRPRGEKLTSALPETTSGSDSLNLNGNVDIKPNYPRLSRILGEEGQVTVHFQEDNSNWEINILKSSGFERLDQAAMNAVKSALKGKQLKVDDSDQINILFKLK